MATLILTAAGTALGGPIGGAIGAAIGQQADQALFGTRRRQGPRLGDLAVQISAYGAQIPKLFGTMRVAGSVIWATDINERRSSGGGGKGQPRTTSYSYSASFAVALSARPIRRVRRIWADGKLLRGAGGDFKTRTRYRLYLGDEEQAPDPYIAATEGIGQTPAFRGVAYAMFEDLELADFGNRIPSLTFEVEADDGAFAIGAIAEALGAGIVEAGATPELGGYAVTGDSIRGAIEALTDVVPLSLTDSGSALVLRSEADEPVAIGADESGAASDGGAGRTEIVRSAVARMPDAVSIGYHDPARDYQSGLQRASIGAAARHIDARALPAAIDAERAKALAEHRLATLLAGRTRATLHLPWRRSALRPGAYVRIEGEAGVWKVESWTLEGMVVRLGVMRVATGTVASAVGASPGRPVAQPDQLHGPTILHAIDALLADAPLDRPMLTIAAAGPEPGWRQAELMASFDRGLSWQPAGTTAAPAVVGVVEQAPSEAGAALFDATNSVIVQLAHEEMWLESRSDAALAGGANLAIIGEELIQFGLAEPLGQRRFRLSRLLRGRRGSEWAASGHLPGERFVLIDRESVIALEIPIAALGNEVRLLAAGIGDSDEGVVTSLTATGESVRPPSPVHLDAERLANGDIRMRWVRRSRRGWEWLDGSDAPLGEERELYRIDIVAAGNARAVTIEQPEYLYTAAEQAADGIAGALTVTVAQLGTMRASRPATISI